jgi:hypothetical protein
MSVNSGEQQPTGAFSRRSFMTAGSAALTAVVITGMTEAHTSKQTSVSSISVRFSTDK